MERCPLDEETLMSEALLMIPVVDYLLREKWNRLIGEWSLDASGQDVPKGAVNFDLYAENASDMALIEWKYIKKNRNQRLIVAFVKLALPGRSFNVRFLLAANRKKSNMLKAIAYKEKKPYIITTWQRRKIIK